MKRRQFTKALCAAPLAACVPPSVATRCMTYDPRNIVITVGGHEIRGFSDPVDVSWCTKSGDEIIRDVPAMWRAMRDGP